MYVCVYMYKYMRSVPPWATAVAAAARTHINNDNKSNTHTQY